MKTIVNKWQGEAGIAVLGVVLTLVIVAGLLLPATLGYIGTAAKAGQIVERKTGEYYSANAGIDAAQWRIKTDGKLPAWLDAVNWGESVYGHNPAYESYSLSPGDPVNDNSVVYEIGPKWVLDGLETPNGTQQRDPATYIVVAGNYVGVGSSSGQGKYEIALYFDSSISRVRVGRIACWLPAGSQLVPDSSNLGQAGGQVYHCDPTTYAYRGGTVVSWNYASPIYYDQLPLDGTRYIVTFEFTPNQIPQGIYCWMKTNDTGANYLAWNTDLKVFELTSTATSPSGQSTVVTAYSSKKEFQKFGSVIEGDYIAIGNTLMRDTNNSLQRNRDRLYKESSRTISTIPANAQVQMIYLYWTGWKCKPWNAGSYSASTRATWPATYGVNKVKLNVVYNGVTCSLPAVTATTTQVLPNGSSHGWSYSCFANITSSVKDYFSSHGGGFVGNGSYTVGHWDLSTSSSGRYSLWGMIQDDPFPYESEAVASSPRYTRYPLGSPRDGNRTDSTSYKEWQGNEDQWAHAAWSVIVIYTSPSTKGHQIYVYDTYRYAQYTTLNFTISGFLTPDLTSEPDAAKVTCFVGEGDGGVDPPPSSTDFTGDSITVNGTTLPGDADNPADDVWNSQSRIEGNLVQGIDIDTFNISSTIIQPGDDAATVALYTNVDAWNLVYMILSFRSKLTAGGIFIYSLE